MKNLTTLMAVLSVQCCHVVWATEVEVKEPAPQTTVFNIPPNFVPELQQDVIEFVSGELTEESVANLMAVNDEFQREEEKQEWLEQIKNAFAARPIIEFFNEYNKSQGGIGNYTPTKQAQMLRDATTPEMATKFLSEYITAFRNNASDIDVFFNAGANQNGPDDHGATTFFTAVRYMGNQAAVVKKFLAHGGNPNLAPKNACSMLCCAIRHGNKESIDALLEAGANPDGQSSDYSPLIPAIESKNIYAIKALLNAGANPNLISKTPESFPGPPLFSAIIDSILYGNTEKLQLLLDNGADPNLSYNGWTAYDEAFAHGDLRVMKVLYNAGAKTRAGFFLDSIFVSVRTTIKHNPRTTAATIILTALWTWYLWETYKNQEEDLSVDGEQKVSGFIPFIKDHWKEAVALVGSVGVIACCKHFDNRAKQNY
ncbi:MAG: ankyrin repeat domain-containing protein [Candidatus Babeliales bacterium]